MSSNALHLLEVAGKRTRSSTSPARAEQLRRAKRKQRARGRAHGLRQVQLVLPSDVAERLRVAGRDPRFGSLLEALLDEAVVRISDYPVLADITWNLRVTYLPAREAFGLYERNWRYVDPKALGPQERALVARLTKAYGAGILHA